MTAFLELLSRRAFENLDVDLHEVDLHGWKCPTFAEQFERHLDTVTAGGAGGTPLVVVEVGSWKGRSTVAMATACKARGLDARIVAVDTWLGAPEFWTWGLEDPTRGLSLNVAHGYPRVYFTFARNIKRLGLAALCSPLPISSVQGAAVLRHHGVLADIVYVDAAHEHDAVAADLAAYWPLVKPGGVMFGDDYTAGWPGVVSAVTEFAAARGLRVDVSGVLWTLRKAA